MISLHEEHKKKCNCSALESCAVQMSRNQTRRVVSGFFINHLPCQGGRSRCLEVHRPGKRSDKFFRKNGRLNGRKKPVPSDSTSHSRAVHRDLLVCVNQAKSHSQHNEDRSCGTSFPLL